MHDTILQHTLKHWTSTRKTRVSPKGWVSGNAPCCVHHGESKDTRGRGGIRPTEGGGFSFNCFNCKFKTGFTPGKPLPHKLRDLLRWIGADENEINYLVIEAMRMRDLESYIPQELKEHEVIEFKERPLPPGSAAIMGRLAFLALTDVNVDNIEVPDDLMSAIDYAADRLGDLREYPDIYWTEDKADAMNKRIIFPFTWNGKNVGYVARSFKKTIMPKYTANHDSDFVYGLDNLVKESEFVLVFEGVIDALLMNGVAVLSNSVSTQQADLIEQLGKQVILVPDLEKSGIPLINTAIEYGWHVAFPEWEGDVKDAGKACQRYGKLFTLKSIISSVATNKTKIEVLKRRIHG